MGNALEIQVAVLVERVEQLTAMLDSAVATQKEQAIQFQKIQEALASQKPWTTLIQHIITAVVTGFAAWFVTQGQHKS